MLLGVRRFNPSLALRSGGIREPFKLWLTAVLSDFGLATTNFFGSTTDAGSDMKRMMKKELGLQWEWCIPHLTAAATKMACGMTKRTAGGGGINPGRTALISRIRLVIFTIKHVEVMGDHFAQLCDQSSSGSSRQLLNSKERFIGLAQVLQRILEKWECMELWYAKRAENAEAARKPRPPPHPLFGEKLPHGVDVIPATHH